MYNKEKNTEKCRLWREKNRKKIRKYNREYNKKYRKENGYENELKWKKKNPEKVLAEQLLRKAVRDGEILKKECEVCESPKTVAHHDNYEFPLCVRWLCRLHHKQHHLGLLDKNIK